MVNGRGIINYTFKHTRMIMTQVMIDISREDYNRELNSLNDDIVHYHEGAVFTSTEILLADGTTLELGMRESEENENKLELILLHHSNNTAKEFYIYKEDCNRRLKALHT